jgi:hypothetical protein
MDVERVLSLDDPKLRIDSLAVVVRPKNVGLASAGGENGHHGHAHLGWGDVTFGLCVGTSDGCVALYSVATIEETSVGLANGTAERFAQAKRVHKRSLECGKLPVTTVLTELRLKEPRLVCLCNGKVVMLNADSLDLLHTFANVKALDGASLIALSQTSAAPEPVPGSPSTQTNSTLMESSLAAASSSSSIVPTSTAAPTRETPRLAALVKQKVLLYEFGESSCTPCVSSTGQQLHVGDGVIQLEWTGNYVIVATKRDYTIYEARTHQLLDQLVFGRGQPGPLLRPMPNGTIGLRNGNALILWGQQRGITFEAAPSNTRSEAGANVGTSAGASGGGAGAVGGNAAATSASGPAAGSASSAFMDDLGVVTLARPFYVLVTNSGKVALRSLIDEGPYPAAPSLPATQTFSLKAAAGRKGCLFVASHREVFALAPVPAMQVVHGYIRAGMLGRATHHNATTQQPPDPPPIALHTI